MIDAAIVSSLKRHFGEKANIGLQAITGGDIHHSYKATIETSSNNLGQELFLKVNSVLNSKVLISEHQSLEILNNFEGTNYPSPIFIEQLSDCTVLALQFLRLSQLGSRHGEQVANLLAQQHEISSDRFGWQASNHIGLTVQKNSWADDWIGFYHEQRLLPQLSLADDNGLSERLQNRIKTLITKLDFYFENHQPRPSLLHGDLWSGNVALNNDTQKPVFYDPAPYFGDAETDIAMTMLFGGFDASFYKRYYALRPPPQGHEQRIAIYNLYHALNHFNLFGSGYEALVANQLDKL